MRAAVVRAFGSPENVVVEECPAPTPAAGEIVARVDAAGVNFADVLMIAGRYQVRPPLPFIAGLEFCGRITAVGPGVERWRPGDRVMGAPLHGGCFAEQVKAPANQVFPAPQSLSDELAAQFVVAYGTAAFALRSASLRPGETILVTGAGGGVGVAAVDIATRIGARVLAAAGSPVKLEAARRHGAHRGLDYSSGQLASAVREATGGRGADVALDTVGGEVFDETLRSMSERGRVLVVGFASGAIPRIPAERLLRGNLSVLGIGFGGILGTEPATVGAVLDDLLALHAERSFTAEIAGRYPLGETARALARLRDRGVAGKLLIEPALDGSAAPRGAHGREADQSATRRVT